MTPEARWFNEQRWHTRIVLLGLIAVGAIGVYRLGLVGALGFALAGVTHGYKGRSLYGLAGSLLLSGVARVVQRKIFHADSGVL